LQKRQPRPQIGIVAHDHRPADDVGMATNIFGYRVNNEVDAIVERPLHGRRGEGVVHDRDEPAAARQCRNGTKVGELQQRIAGGLDPDQRRCRRHGGLDRIHIPGVDMRDREVGRTGSHLMKQSPGATIDVARSNDVATVLEKVEHGGFRGQTRRKRKAGGTALRIRERGFKSGPCRILRARIFPALMFTG
jgi:hypothetical protein